MGTNEEEVDQASGAERLHRNNAAEWLMVIAVAPAVLLARVALWLKSKFSSV